MNQQIVYFIGAGPGSADLITLRGARALERAQVVLFDALSDPGLRDLAPQAQWLDVGKRGFSDRPDSNSNGQARINALLVEQALRHPVVARLKGGDPSMFGRLDEELQAVRAAGLACEVIPGVTAALAAAADAQRPLTRRGAGRSVSLATAMTRTGDLHATRSADTEIYYMAGRQLPEIGRRLLVAGWPADAPVSVISRAGWPDQRSSDHTVGSLGDAEPMHSGRPTVVVVGIGALPVGASDPLSVEGHQSRPVRPAL